MRLFHKFVKPVGFTLVLLLLQAGCSTIRLEQRPSRAEYYDGLLTPYKFSLQETDKIQLYVEGKPLTRFDSFNVPQKTETYTTLSITF